MSTVHTFGLTLFGRFCRHAPAERASAPAGPSTVAYCRYAYSMLRSTQQRTRIGRCVTRASVKNSMLAGAAIGTIKYSPIGPAGSRCAGAA